MMGINIYIYMHMYKYTYIFVHIHNCLSSKLLISLIVSTWGRRQHTFYDQHFMFVYYAYFSLDEFGLVAKNSRRWIE